MSARPEQEIEARVWEHNEGVYDGYTKSRRPVTLVFTETYDRLTDGHARERQIKGWSRARSSLPLVGRGRGGGGPAHIRCGKGCIGGGALFGTVMGCAPPPLSPPHKGEGDALRLLCLNPTQVPHPGDLCTADIFNGLEPLKRLQARLLPLVLRFMSPKGQPVLCVLRLRWQR